MFRKRERFERRDVPRENPYTNVIGLAVVAIVAVLVGIVVVTLWDRAQLESHLGDHGLNKAVKSQSVSGNPDGTTQSDDDFLTYAVISTNSLKAGDSTLQSVRLLVIDRTQGTGHIVSIPTDVYAEVDSNAKTLADIYKDDGQSAFVSALASVTNIKITHVIIATDDVWEKISALSGSGARSLVSNASSLLSSMITDMNPNQLLELVEIVQPIGVSNLEHDEAPVVEGSSGTTVDPTALGKLVGMLV